MADHQNDDEQEIRGMALGFRIFEDEGQLFYAEAELAPYVDEPESLGATLVFHLLSGLDPTAEEEEPDWPTWTTDIDDDLTRDSDAAMAAQFEDILRQLSRLSEAELRRYLQQAREEEAEGE